ncbi:MAG: chorismate synthase [Gammaproteobacteria bacterium RIFCSPHIGHO2_12_38_15]|nr:MAG: chorismate synthase [Gammaproteobacteria bacterium RIFCSPHIGHO2_12_38_15]
MASNSFGNLFRITSWGESHGLAMGVVIDGCPAGVDLSEEEINHALSLRAPGRNSHVSARQEKDDAKIYSGVFEGKTTGAPISIIIFNKDADSSKYETIKNNFRPGHAHFTYLNKYGIYDYRGGGRASARETVCRVAAGAVARKILSLFSIEIIAYLSAVGNIQCKIPENKKINEFKKNIIENSVFCPDEAISKKIIQAISKAKKRGDSLGGVVEFIATGLPVGLGDPMYEKLEANLAKAMLSLPASKGFEVGEGFHAASMSGSTHNDLFVCSDGHIQTQTNHAGGILGGISTGMSLGGRVAFKPTSSIAKPQQTVDTQGQETILNLPEGSRHDPCVAVRAVPVVEAMCALVLVDALLMNRCAKCF